ncbi:MAG: hypothetical protein R3Y33_04520 [Clostridia bacterium]
MVDIEFYSFVYLGQNFTVDSEDFETYESFASDDINSLTSWQIEDIDTLPENIATLIKKAVCTQIDYLYDNGITESNISSVGLGKFNYSKGNNGTQKAYDKRVRRLLEPTGLLYRGVLC